jgi:CheY-like chemotaxis protein
VSVSERAGYRILNLVNLSLDLFRMEQGTYRFEPRPVDMADLVGKVLVDVLSHAESKNVLIRTLVNGRASSVQSPVYAWGDELLCYSMLGNLVKNAIEAAPEGGTVTISVEGPRDVVMLRLHNPGAVPQAIRDSFFEKYASAGKSEGTGLGTYSARLMARTQGGDISMRTSADAGTTITIWLRAAPASAMPAAPDPRREHREAASLAKLGRLRVLVVDDDEFNRLIVRRYLPPPVVVDSAVNGRAAVDAAVHRPDVILMDLDMPIMDGFEAVARIRDAEAREGRRRAAIIALSSHDDDGTRARCLASGFDYYLTKPVTRELLHQTIARFCASASALEAAPEVDDDLKEMLPGFIASRRALAAELEEAVRANDREQVRRIAHKLAGSFALYGFAWAADHCKRLERDAASAELEQLGTMTAALRDHLDKVAVAPSAS